ncbi:Inositol phosphatase SIW14 [Basidiobolus ranarum]|uniref:ER membrane protein complex subunit 2 n=1 Tax=Basidiobolus ranarum TaxID=34480 RepID=A0ABR2WQN5_9FUNG
MLFGGYATQLGDEVWNVYEQVLIAALDTGRLDLAKSCLSKLQARFPKVQRVKSLEGMSLEAEEKLEENYVLSTWTNLCMFNSYGQVEKYFNSLFKLKCIFIRYQQAAFRIEEIILLQPLNHLFHLKYAEVLFTMNNIPMALKEFCRVIELCTDHVRRLYGIKACTSRLLKPSSESSSRNSNDSTKHFSELDVMTSERLLNIYCKSKTDKQTKKVVEAWLIN